MFEGFFFFENKLSDDSIYRIWTCFSQIFYYNPPTIPPTKSSFMNETKKSKKKRKKGTGQIEMLPSGSIRLKVPVTDADGMKRMKSFTGMSLKEAETKRDAYLDVLKAAKEEREFYFKRFEDAVNIWLYERKVVQLSEASFKRLKSTFYVNIFPEIGKTPLNQIDSSRLQKLINGRLNDLSYSSVKKMHDGLNNFYKWTVVTRKLGYNRMMGVELPERDFFTIKTKEIEIIPDNKIKDLIEVALSRRKNEKLTHLGLQSSFFC